MWASTVRPVARRRALPGANSTSSFTTRLTLFAEASTSPWSLMAAGTAKAVLADAGAVGTTGAVLAAAADCCGTVPLAADRTAGVLAAAAALPACDGSAGAGVLPTSDLPLQATAIADVAAREGLWHHVDGAYGGFFIPKSYGSSIALTGGPEAALYVFIAFYVTCIAMTWWYYARKNAEMPC